MKPEKEGVYEWFSNSGEKTIVCVCNVAPKNLGFAPHLRVYWKGGYYNVYDEEIGTEWEGFCRAEWVNGTWGKYLGTLEQWKDFDF